VLAFLKVILYAEGLLLLHVEHKNWYALPTAQGQLYALDHQ